jgi:hypothetical protein
MNADAPLFVVGADRSGTTLLRVMLNRHPELAIPPESHFIPRLWRRRRRYGRNDRVEDVELFAADLATDIRFRKWELPIKAVRAELNRETSPSIADALRAPFLAYAKERGRRSWGDKTPGYAAHIPLLSSLWPSAKIVHFVRDGRDVALSVLDLQRGMHQHAATVAHFWADRVRAARAAADDLGPGRYLELRYEDLLDDPRRELERLCDFAGLPFTDSLLEHDDRALEEIPVAERRRHARVALPPTRGLRDWRKQMPAREIAEFEAIAGPELDALGYLRGAESIGSGTILRARLRMLTFAVSSLPRRVRVVAMQRRRRRDFSRALGTVME